MLTLSESTTADATAQSMLLQAAFPENVSTGSVMTVTITVGYSLPGNDSAAELIVELQNAVDNSFIESIPAASPFPCEPSRKATVMGGLGVCFILIAQNSGSEIVTFTFRARETPGQLALNSSASLLDLSKMTEYTGRTNKILEITVHPSPDYGLLVYGFETTAVIAGISFLLFRRKRRSRDVPVKNASQL